MSKDITKDSYSFLPREIQERVAINNYLTIDSLRKGFKRIEKLAPFINHGKIKEILDVRNSKISWSKKKSHKYIENSSLNQITRFKNISPPRKQVALPKIISKVNKNLLETTQERFFINTILEDYNESSLMIKPVEVINRKIIFSTFQSPKRGLINYY
jgi:hypothetical protein